MFKFHPVKKTTKNDQCRLILLTGNYSSGRLRVDIIDVGQSDCILIEGPTGDTMLVDSGHWLDEGETVLEYIDKRGIDYIDCLISTHDDADHMGGHAAIIEEFGSDRIGAVHGPDTSGIAPPDTESMGRYENALDENGMKENELREGSSAININGVDVNVLNPSSMVDNKGRNENSLVLQVTYGEQSVLLTGDAIDDAETHLIDDYSEQLSQVDVLKAAHHGDDKGTGVELLMTCEPETICFSHGKNSGDHPTREALSRTKLADTEAVSTVVHGSTTFAFDGQETMTVEHEREVETRDVADVTAMTTSRALMAVRTSTRLRVSILPPCPRPSLRGSRRQRFSPPRRASMRQ